MEQIIKILIFSLLLVISAPSAWGQQAEKAFQQGKELMAKKKYKDAIKKFEASMKINKGPENRKNCLSMIDECKSQIKDPKPKPIPEPKRISLVGNTIQFESVPPVGGKLLRVINGEEIAWNFAVPEDAKNWCVVEKSSDNGGLVIKCSPSTKTVSRSAILNVMSINDNYTLTVRQQGIKASIAVSSKIVSAKKKGDQLVIPIVCTSDTIYADGNSWRVLSAPKWCHQTYKKKPKTNTLQKAFLVVSNGFADTGKEVKYQEEPAEKKELVLNIDKLDKAEGKERTGDIVLECQGQTERFSILQK